MSDDLEHLYLSYLEERSIVGGGKKPVSFLRRLRQSKNMKIGASVEVIQYEPESSNSSSDSDSDSESESDSDLSSDSNSDSDININNVIKKPTESTNDDVKIDDLFSGDDNDISIQDLYTEEQ